MTRTSGRKGSGGQGKGGAKGGKAETVKNRLGRTRLLHTNVKTARSRDKASTRWLQRQLNDPYVALAKQEGYRSRAAYKLMEIDEKFSILTPGSYIVDLGAAPGGWTQVALEIVTRGGAKGKVVGVDILPIDPLGEHAVLLQLDFTKDEAPNMVKQALGGQSPQVVLTDMAPSFTGHASTDHLRTMHLVDLALEFAEATLAPGGHFAAKILHGAEEHLLLDKLKKLFQKVKVFKPDSSRDDSSEIYVVATGYKGA